MGAIIVVKKTVGKIAHSNLSIFCRRRSSAGVHKPSTAIFFKSGPEGN
jgi:hypothetical protein